MHMADALLSPVVGGAAWAASGATIVYCAGKLKKDIDDSKIPLMGVLGAFVFAAQMINFTIPATGSSGHIGGGLLLAILLGPHAALLTIASVLTVQALFFADGGLLALGCNIFNLGVFPSFIAYPFIYKQIVRTPITPTRLLSGSVIAAVVALQLGAFAVVVETFLSGIAELPFISFVMVMQPIHLAIGLAEGFATAGVISFIWQARPEILEQAIASQPLARTPMKSVLTTLLIAALLTGGALSWYASEQPDGLEWSIARLTGQEEVQPAGHPLHSTLANLQQKTALMPDYDFKAAGETTPAGGMTGDHQTGTNISTSVAGLVGGTLTLMLALLTGLALRRGKTHP